MAETKNKTTKDEQIKAEVLSGILDEEARTYTMRKTVSVDGKEREGTFVFRYPTLGNRLDQGVIQTKYLRGTPIDSLDLVTYNIAYAMSFLASITVRKPSWFAYENMDDADELQEMFGEVNEFVRSFRTKTSADSDTANS